MTSRFTDFDVKMAILEILSNTRTENKFNLIGRGHQRGPLEQILNVTFTNEERALAGKAVEELKQARLIHSNYTDLADPENWLEISESGRNALSQRALDDLDLALRRINPALCEMRHGAYAALLSGQPDSVRQAAHSARELIRQVLDILAPLGEIRAQPDFRPSKESQQGVTRKMRIRYVINKRQKGFSESDVDIVDSLCDPIDVLYNKLSAEAHRDVDRSQQDVQDLLRATEIVLRRLLS
jgi:Predicted pPIWI-associating nuclease